MSVSQRSGSEERDRILKGFTAVVAERGYRETTLDVVFAGAGIEGAAFHRHFADKEECFLAAWDFITERYVPAALAAYEGEETWREQMRAVGVALIAYMIEHPDHARILFVESLRPGERAWALLDRNIAFFVELIDRGREEMDDPESLTRATAEGLAGAVHEQFALLLSRGGVEELPTLLAPLMYMVVRPYLGDEVALEELRRA